MLIKNYTNETNFRAFEQRMSRNVFPDFKGLPFHELVGRNFLIALKCCQ